MWCHPFILHFLSISCFLFHDYYLFCILHVFFSFVYFVNSRWNLYLFTYLFMHAFLKQFIYDTPLINVDALPWWAACSPGRSVAVIEIIKHTQLEENLPKFDFITFYILLLSLWKIHIIIIIICNIFLKASLLKILKPVTHILNCIFESCNYPE